MTLRGVSLRVSRVLWDDDQVLPQTTMPMRLSGLFRGNPAHTVKYDDALNATRRLTNGAGPRRD
jgi:hypothetical protein